jgi:hypothetical protein
MQHLDRDKVTEAEECLIAPCGIYCGACDPFLGRSKELARELYKIINGFNIADVAPIVLGVEQERMKDFLTILKQMGEAKACPGCLAGGGNPACPIKICSREKGYLICAECDRMPCSGADNNAEAEPMSAPRILEMITKRYANWNIENLQRIRAKGYRRFIDEMQQKVRKGFLTSDVISGEMVVTEFLEKLSK